MKKSISLLLILLITLGTFQASQLFAQNRKSLERKLKDHKRQIAITQGILKETKIRQSQNLEVLKLLQSQIRERKGLIETIDEEVSQLELDIVDASSDISALTNEIEDLKNEFSKLIYDGYKLKRKQTPIGFLLSSSDFNQAYKRIAFIKRLMEYRKKQLDLIVIKQQENSLKINELIASKNEKMKLLHDQQLEVDKMVEDEESSKTIIDGLKGKEKELKDKLKEQRKATKELNKAIERAIADEVRRAAEEKRRRAADRQADVNLPERKKATAASSFAKSYGKLGWPVSNGYISERFGRHKHPTLKDITTENNGVNITTKSGSRVRAVYSGEVSAVMQVPGMKNSILIKHGEYYTVYANLDEVNVKRGQKVKENQNLGRVVADENGVANFHFEVWKGTQKLNPEKWLGSNK